MKQFLIFALLLGVFAIGFQACEENACQGVECGEFGVCFEGTCLCDRGYEGDSCNIVSRADMLGTYMAFKDCGTGEIDTLEMMIIEGTGDLSTFLVTDFDDFACLTEQEILLEGNANAGDALVFDFIGACDSEFEGDGTNFINLNTGLQTVSINMSINYFDTVDSINVVESCAYTLRR